MCRYKVKGCVCREWDILKSESCVGIFINTLSLAPMHPHRVKRYDHISQKLMAKKFRDVMMHRTIGSTMRLID